MRGRIDPMIFALGYALVVPPVVGLIAGGELPKMGGTLWSETAAAWAQAIFSVLAIIAAWQLSGRQAAQQRIENTIAQTEFLEAVIRVMHPVRESLPDIYALVNEGEYERLKDWVSNASALVRKLEKLEDLPVNAWPHAYIGVEYGAYVSGVRHLADRAERALQNRHTAGENRSGSISRLKVALTEQVAADRLFTQIILDYFDRMGVLPKSPTS